MGEMSWTTENMPQIKDRVIVKGHSGWWTVQHVDGPVVTLRHVDMPNVRTVQHVDNLEPMAA